MRVPRCRYHLFRTVTLSSSSDVFSVVHLLSESPLLAPRVSQPVLIGSPEADQSWVSSVPVRSGGRLSGLEGVTMKGIDLRDRHPDFFKAWALCRAITYLVFENVCYARYAQVYRLAIATQAEEYSIKDEVVFVPRDTSTLVRRRPGLFTFSTVDLLSLELILSWPQLVALSRDYCKIAGLRLSKIRVRVELGDLRVDDMGSQELGQAASLFRRLCTHAPLAYLEMKVAMADRTIAMMHGGRSHPSSQSQDLMHFADKWGWMVPARQTKLDLIIWPVHSRYPSDHTRRISYLLGSFSAPRFDVVAITLLPVVLSEPKSVAETDALVLQSLISQWRVVDEVFAQPNWTNLADLKVRLALHTHNFPEPHQFKPELMEKLLPRLSGRNVPAKFYVSCSYLESQYVVFFALLCTSHHRNYILTD